MEEKTVKCLYYQLQTISKLQKTFSNNLKSLKILILQSVITKRNNYTTIDQKIRVNLLMKKNVLSWISY